MPSGKTHIILEALAIGPVLFLYQSIDFDVGRAVAFAGGYALGTLLLSPDLDLPQSNPSRRWGAFRRVWSLYQWWFKHRGVSHNPAWGPILRLAYVGLVFALVVVVLDRQGQTLRALAGWPVESVILGVYCSNALHVFADSVSTRWKRSRWGRLRARRAEPRPPVGPASS